MKHYYDFTIADFSFLNLPPTYGVLRLTKQAIENPKLLGLFSWIIKAGLVMHAEINTDDAEITYIVWHPLFIETPPNTQLPQYKINFAQRTFTLQAAFNKQD